MTHNILIILAIILSFSGCRQSSIKEAGNLPVIEKPKALTILKAKHIPPEKSSDTVRINFGDFILLMLNIEVYKNDSISGRDTIEISPEIGYDLDSQIVILQSKPDIKSIEVFESYKTVLSVQNEGPHLDLYDWKGFESEWTAVKPLKDRHFMMSFISPKEASEFPAFTKEELIEVAEKDENNWGDIIRKPYSGNWKNHYETGVGIRRLKFVITDVQGKVSEKYLVAYIAMGC